VALPFDNEHEPNADRLGRDWCVTCKQFKYICCGDTTNGFWCDDCCPHPYDDRDDGYPYDEEDNEDDPFEAGEALKTRPKSSWELRAERAEAHVAKLAEAAYVLNGTMVPFNEGKQEFFCRVCRYRDPLGPDGGKLHDDNCPLLELLNICESATAADAVDPHAASTGKLTTREKASS
jgi:hypothetical protein